MKINFRKLLKQAQARNISAMFNLAWAFRDGKDTEPDIDQYFAWMKKAAEAGDADSMFCLAWAYRNGYGTATDIDQYFVWMKKAADAGSPNAMYNLAWAYRNGYGTPPDIGQYFVWMKEAADAGIAKALFNLACAYRDGEGTTQDTEQYLKWMKGAADAGDAAAMYNMALCYIHGEVTAPDIDQYFEWMKRAADAGGSYAAVLHYVNGILDDPKTKNVEILHSFADLFYATENIKKRHTFPGTDTSFAHFTDFPTLEKMLPLARDGEPHIASNHLRLYNVEYLNDPSEGCRLFQYMKQHPKCGNVFNTLFETLDKESAISVLHEDLSVYVCSFTLRSDRLDLWRAYGRDGEGVCIVTPVLAFEGNTEFHALAEHLKEAHRPAGMHETALGSAGKQAGKDTAQRQTAPRVLYRVKYEDDEIRETLEELLAPLEKITNQLLALDEQMRSALRKCVIALMIDILFLYKNQEYKNEEEARLIFAAQIDHPMLELDDRSPGKLFVRTADFLFEWEDSRIIIGPRVKDKKAVELNLKYRLHKHDLKSVRVEQSQVPYR